MNRLVIQARQGDKSAEKKVFEYLRVRFAFIAKRRMDSDEAEDVAQEACLTVLEKYRSEAPADNFEAWAYGILRNKIGNYYQRRDVRRRARATAEIETQWPGAVTAEGDPDVRRRLMACIRRLIKAYPRYARALNLVIQGYDTDEICRRLVLKRGHLYVILNRGRRLLGTCLDKDSPS